MCIYLDWKEDACTKACCEMSDHSGNKQAFVSGPKANIAGVIQKEDNNNPGR